MVQLGSYNASDRHNRPNTLQKVLLRAFFINDGAYQDPVDISGVTIVTKVSNTSPSTILGSDELLSTDLSQSQILMQFGGFASGLASTSYTPVVNASGIYKFGTGEYGVVLDNTLSLSGWYDFNGSAFEVANAASATGNYLDVWTAKLAGGSNYKSIINEFTLYADTFFTMTQPLMLKSSNRLVNKHLTLGSKTDLKFTTEITVENKDIDESVKNIFKDSVITSAMVEISKINDSVNLPSRVEVSGFSDTAALIDVTSDNTIIFTWDTEDIRNLGTTAIEQTKRENLGSPTGTYAARVSYNLLNEKIISPLFHFIVS